jgi:hypothetical protein
MAGARRWSRAKLAAVTTVCGLGHVAGSIAIGAVGIAFGVTLSQLEIIEGQRGTIASWLVLAFGLAYAAWGLRRASTGHRHAHAHVHADGTAHAHDHSHREHHVHVHDSAERRNLTPWVLFVLFVLGPCESLIPLLMAPAAVLSWPAVVVVCAVFAVATVGTMMSAVFIGVAGLGMMPFKTASRYTQALAGGTVAACGGAMILIGA